MPFCSKCGKNVVENAIFCDGCGTRLTPENPVTNEKKEQFEGSIHKCPRCGEVINSFVTNCPSCNHEIRDSKASSSLSAFQAKLEKIDAPTSNYKFKYINNTTQNKTQRKIELISSYPIPNTKEDIREFMILAESKFDEDYYMSHLDVEDVSDAWYAKIKQCYNKAKISFGNDPDFKSIQEIYNDTVGKMERIKEKQKQQAINSYNTRRKIKIISICTIFIAIAVIAIIFTLTSGILTKIKLGSSNDELIGVEYTTVIAQLEKSGFSNIKSVEGSWIYGYHQNEVTHITVDGESYFKASKRFDKQAEIIITYNPAPQILSLGIDQSSVIGADYSSIKEQLTEQGFGNIELSALPWSPDIEPGIIISLTVNGASDYTSESKFMQDSKIIITYSSEPQMVSIGLDSSDFEEMRYSEAVTLLKNKGFAYIETVEDGWSMFHKSEMVKSISIDGKNDFLSFNSFSQDAIIVIYYYK